MSFLTLFKSSKPDPDKARLELFIAALPFPYFAWSRNGDTLYHPDFFKLLGAPSVRTLNDIAQALTPGDAAALETMVNRLRDTGEAFHLNVETFNRDRVLRLFGSRGQDSGDIDPFVILWAEDISEYRREIESLKEKIKDTEALSKTRKTVLDNFPRPLWLRDKTGGLIWCNPSYTEAVKSTADKVIDDQIELSIKPSAQGPTDTRALAYESLKRGKASHLRGHIIIGGERRLMDFHEMPVPGGLITFGYALDRTIEEELEGIHRRDQTAFKELLEHMRSAVALFSSEERLEFSNTAFSQLWDLETQWLNARPKLGDVLEKLRERRMLPEQSDFRRYKQGWLDLFRNLVGTHEDMLHLPNGVSLRLLVVPHPMGGLMMTFEDVTSRLALESSLNTLMAVQKETLDNLGEGVAVYGSDGRLRLWNPSFLKLWSLHPEDVEENPHISKLVERLQPKFGVESWIFAKDILFSQAISRNDANGRLSRSDKILIDWSTVALPDGGVMVTHRDVTDTVQVENALREKADALESAERLKLDFLANVSYQLRTPLNAIMGFNEMLGMQISGTLTDKQLDFTRAIHEASERLTMLIDDILDLSTIEAGYLTLDKTDTDCAALLQSIYDLTVEWSRSVGVVMKLVVTPDLGRAILDSRRIKQGLLHLIRNAIAYTPPGGHVTLNGHRNHENKICFSIEDNGPGIATEDINKMFEPFMRGNPPLHQVDQGISIGAGIGLSIVKRIIETHGGKIKIESTLGKGTHVFLVFP